MFGLKVLTFLYDSFRFYMLKSVSWVGSRSLFLIDAWARNLISTLGSESNFGTILDARLSTRATDVWNHLLTLDLKC